MRSRPKCLYTKPLLTVAATEWKDEETKGNGSGNDMSVMLRYYHDDGMRSAVKAHAQTGVHNFTKLPDTEPWCR